MIYSPTFSFGDTGAKFWIFPQPGFPAEIVRIPPTYGRILAGPRDDILHVVDAKNKTSYKTYDEEGNEIQRSSPPYKGVKFDAVEPGPEGDFDFVAPGTRPFSSTAAFVAVRCTIAAWEHHAETALLPWYFGRPFGPSLEVIAQAKTDGAWMGRGFLEFGFSEYPDRGKPWAENFEAVSHETGHLIMKRFIGDPPKDEKSTQYQAHEEAAADLISLITVLHFDSVIKDTLQRTQGFLLAVTPLSRVSEWGASKALEARRLFNDDTMESVRQASVIDKYQLSRVFSGATYDVLVGLFQRGLVERGVLPDGVSDRARHIPGEPLPDLKDRFAPYFAKAPEEFERALGEARDHLARVLARTWRSVSADGLTYAKVVATMCGVEEITAKESGRTPSIDIIRSAFDRRGIQPAY